MASERTPGFVSCSSTDRRVSRVAGSSREAAQTLQRLQPDGGIRIVCDAVQQSIANVAAGLALQHFDRVNPYTGVGGVPHGRKQPLAHILIVGAPRDLLLTNAVHNNSNVLGIIGLNVPNARCCRD